jgi:hypothetical protein
MKDFLASVGGLVIMVAILLVGGFVIYFFVSGGAKIAVIVLPWLNVAFFICLLLFGLVLMPLSYFTRTKAIAGTGMVIASYVFGLTLWLWGFLLTYAIWGAIAVIIGLFIAGVGVVPIAMLATLINAEWSTLIQLVILTALTFGVRVWGAYLLERAEQIALEKQWVN